MANIKTSMVLNLALLIALLLIVSPAEGRLIFDAGFAKSTPECDIVFGVQERNTCFDIQEAFKLSAGFFNAINPNLNCDALFVGQWVCVSGTA